ncbi:Outer-membrane lipoprotein carrier protein [Thiomonas sp. X19]|uniref:outer membrane lipoprotein chaperone LolA n=1 Tax=Thiomonas sp. X19 TaxID=1050370 RepID=UPI000B656E4C|nr:outer membrane lipoprotein chaperone LolA [Thiomonas sp. X19]SCC92676.1 Outer-membrane lipoprotein carrier protein [Thiomonas sp. X19]
MIARCKFAAALLPVLLSALAFGPYVPAQAQTAVNAPAKPAAGAALLNLWVKSTHSARASFTQTAVDEKGKASASSAGSFEFERPGKFRWIYTKPYHQDIVSDGQTIWTYDHDLDQVTVSAQSRALSGTPAALLAGEDVSKLFTLSPLPSTSGLQWVQAVPRSKDSSFDWVRIGLKSTPQGPELVEMQLRDAFRRTSTIVFIDTQRNVAFAAGHFHFKAPQGASVIQQP